LRTLDTPGLPPPRCPQERLPDLALAGPPCPLCQHLYQEVFRHISPQPLCRLGFHLTHDLHNGARGLKVKGGLEAVVGFVLLLHLQESSGDQEELVLHPQAGEGGEGEGNQSLPVPLAEVVAGEALTSGHGKTREEAVRAEVEVAPKAVVEVKEEVEEERRVGGAWTLGGAGQVSRAGAVVGKVGVEVGALERTGEETQTGLPGQLGRPDRAQERR